MHRTKSNILDYLRIDTVNNRMIVKGQGKKLWIRNFRFYRLGFGYGSLGGKTIMFQILIKKKNNNINYQGSDYIAFAKSFRIQIKIGE